MLTSVGLSSVIFTFSGDIKALVESIEESELSGLKLSNTELLELVHTLSMNGHEDNVQQVLEMTSPEADGFDNAAKKMICR